MKDELFKQSFTGRFEFNEAVAVVFDDMITRSIPFYEQILNLTIQLIDNFCIDGDKIYDFGCSTANTLLAIERAYPSKYSLFGIDMSQHMLKRASSKAEAYGANIELINSDFLDAVCIDAGCVIANFTMQFMTPQDRNKGFQKAYSSLRSGGIFIFAEKLKSENSKLEEFLTEKYYDYKREQNYSELEIMQKRASLENVLLPFSEEKNIQMATAANFEHTECIFRALNFALFVAFKS